MLKWFYICTLIVKIFPSLWFPAGFRWYLKGWISLGPQHL